MKTRITKRSVEAAKPGARDQFLWDNKLTGFGVKITPAGKRVYVTQYRFKGRIRRYTIGEHGAPLTAEKAREDAERVLSAAKAGHDPAELKVAARKAPALREVADDYLTDWAPAYKKPRTVEEDRRNLKLHILPVLGARKIADITDADVASLHRKMRDTPGAANRAIAVLSKIMTLAETEWKYRPRNSNPCHGIRKHKTRDHERFLSAEELARLGAVLAEAEADGSEMPSVTTALRLLILTGARKSEILTAKWKYVNFEAGYLYLPDSKTGQKPIPLGAAALEVLANAPRLDDNSYICFGDRPGSHLVGLQKAWERLRTKAGLEDTRVHDLRHSFASVGAAGGDSLYVISKLLGHKTLATTERYAHLADDPLHRAADRISGHIDAAMRRQETGEVVKLDRNG